MRLPKSTTSVANTNQGLVPIGETPSGRGGSVVIGSFISVLERAPHDPFIRRFGTGMKTPAVIFVLVSFFVAGCSPDIAQHAHPKAADTAMTPFATLSSQDRDFIEEAARGNLAEISIGALVDGRALRPEVAAFGHTMVSDHGAAGRQLAAIALDRHIALPTTLGEHQAGFDRVVDRRLDPFDREFMKVMLGEHQEAVELFRSEASSGKDPQLRAFAEAGLPMIESHTREAAMLAETVDAPEDPAPSPTSDSDGPPPHKSVHPARP
jgi:putative membrane protein